MRLIACPACGRQYDVTHHPEGEAVRCLCDQRLVVTAVRPHTPRAMRCSSCGAALAKDSTTCGYCRSATTIEEKNLSAICPHCFARMAIDAHFCMECGTKIAPQALLPVPDGATCPRCESELRSRSLDSISVIECSSCGGLWVPPTTFESLCLRADRDTAFAASVRSDEASRPVPDHAFRYLPCIRCGDMMVPRNFDRTSGVIIDVCGKHGVWLDRHELEKVVAHVRQKGLSPEAAIQRPFPASRGSYRPSPPTDGSWDSVYWVVEAIRTLAHFMFRGMM